MSPVPEVEPPRCAHREYFRLRPQAVDKVGNFLNGLTPGIVLVLEGRGRVGSRQFLAERDGETRIFHVARYLNALHSLKETKP
jgi:hypothetical protein